MKKYLFNQVCGMSQGDMIIVEAENATDAVQKAGMKEVIKPYEKFKEPYFGKIYECREVGTVKTELYCHK